MARTTSFTSSPRARRTRVVVRVGRREDGRPERGSDLVGAIARERGQLEGGEQSRQPSVLLRLARRGPASANAGFSGFEMRLGVGAPRVERCSRSSASLTA